MIVFSVALAKAETYGFGYELIMNALETLQTNDLSLDRTLRSVVTKVDQVIDDQRLFKSTMQNHLRYTEQNGRTVATKMENLVDHTKTVAAKLDKLIDLIAEEQRCPESATDGVYNLKPAHSSIPTFPVYCEDGWIVIHRRFNGSLDFNREWVPYREGFGDLQGEHWLGLEKMHQITRVGSYELKVVMKSFEGVEKSAQYKGFKIGSELTQYQLGLEEFDGGDAGDSFMHHNGMKFSTPDRDNDQSGPEKTPCAVFFKSGWWFAGCHHTNLNGLYEKGKIFNTMSWWHFNQKHDCLKEARMLIRRK